jgi:hypothetical protein
MMMRLEPIEVRGIDLQAIYVGGGRWNRSISEVKEMFDTLEGRLTSDP